ncbi:expressed unknown protein [Seminavis robusta]|uniref:N-acetyltransferase domain-containing protein n=1 Tax=Seminavis robusta TaxID=568900 RepID=A0A9N8E014_9STRA|nr:expressed unknown protein [Seminavis robusta]|eukprot:Sro402_g135490.1 n/a (185) ;mRNA; f:47040-47682
MADIEPVADLLVDCFETELKWFEFPEREARRKKYRDMLQSSLLRRIQKASSSEDETTQSLSFMLLVESAKEPGNKMLGFVQVGMLPPPPGFQPTNDDSDQAITKDVPYIANLCVLPSNRKHGIGKKMVDICTRWLAKKEQQNVFIAVESDNLVAKRFYQGINFAWIEPPGVSSQRDYYYRPISS